MPNSDYIVIVGCGRLGSILASNLSSAGNSVVVIDSDDNSFNHLTSKFSGFQIVGDAAELSVLQTAKANKADCLLAVTNNDNINLMVAQIAQTVFKVPKVLARIFDPEREEIYRDFGIKTISPTQLSADALLKLMKN